MPVSSEGTGAADPWVPVPAQDDPWAAPERPEDAWSGVDPSGEAWSPSATTDADAWADAGGSGTGARPAGTRTSPSRPESSDRSGGGLPARKSGSGQTPTSDRRGSAGRSARADLPGAVGRSATQGETPTLADLAAVLTPASALVARHAPGTGTGQPASGPEPEVAADADADTGARAGSGVGTARVGDTAALSRRPRRGRPAQEHPEAGSAAQDDEPDTESVARAIVLRQLTAAPRSRHQLADTLVRREVPEDVAEKVLNRFTEVGLIDDAAYAETLVRARHTERGLSRRALVQELRRKGVAPEDAEAALAQIGDDEEESAARTLARRKLRATRGLDREVRMRRTYAALGRKGYGAGLVSRVVREELAAEGRDEILPD